MLRFKTLSKLVLIAVVTFFGCRFFKKDPPSHKNRIAFDVPVKSVRDSMLVLRQICERFRPTDFFSCKIIPSDSTLFFDTEVLGKLAAITASNPAFKDMKKGDAIRLVAILKYLHEEQISGIYHDVSIGPFWLYPYGEHLGGHRKLFLWKSPGDTLTPAFKRNFRIID